jgi:hypothetical protein
MEPIDRLEIQPRQQSAYESQANLCFSQSFLSSLYHVYIIAFNQLGESAPHPKLASNKIKMVHGHN